MKDRIDPNPIAEDIVRLVKGTFYSFGSFVLVRLITALNSIIIARLLKPSNLGVLMILEQIQTVFIIFATLGIPLAIAKYISETSGKDPAADKIFFDTSFLITICVSIVFCGLYALFNKSIARFYNEPALAIMVIFSAVTVFFTSLWETGGGALRGWQEIKLLSILRVIQWIIILPVNIIFIKIMGLIGAALAVMLCSILNFLIIIFCLGSKARNRGIPIKPEVIDRKASRSLMSYGFPATISALLCTIPLWIAVSFISKRIDFASVGYFRVANALMAIIMSIPISLSVPIIPLLSELDKNDLPRMKRFFHLSNRLTVLVMIPVTLGLALFSKYLISFLYGADFYPAWRILYLLCGGVFFYAVANLIGNLIAATGRMWQGVVLNTLWAVIFVALSFILTGRYGLTGFGYAYLISYVVHAILSFIYVRVGYKLEIGNLVGIILFTVLGFGIIYFILHLKFLNNTWLLIISILFWLCIVGITYLLAKKEERVVFGKLLSLLPFVGSRWESKN